MPQSNERIARRSFVVCLAATTSLAFLVPVTPSFAQAAGHVRVKIVKAALLVGGGKGSGVLTWRGRNYPFKVFGLSLGITAGATIGRLDGWGLGHP